MGQDVTSPRCRSRSLTWPIKIPRFSQVRTGTLQQSALVDACPPVRLNHRRRHVDLQRVASALCLR
jgi:hypothetical protein